MAFYKMSSKEELGDSVTHFFKTGGVLRQENEELVALKKLLPVQGPNGTRVEYDVWYDMNDPKSVHGYVYTDAMSKFIYLRVGDANRSHLSMEQAAKCLPTEEGRQILEDLAATSSDKYKLKSTDTIYEKVVFLAGANILNKAIDWDKLGALVKDGWMLKCHPLTSRDLRQLLINKYGKSSIIDKKISGYSLLEGASEIACAENSEMGIVGIAKGKLLTSVGCGNRQLTYSAIYNQLHKASDKKDTLLRILSSKDSGLVPVIIANPLERISAFFDKYRDIPHVKPK